MNVLSLKRIAREFFHSRSVAEIFPFGEGHINDTFKLTLVGVQEAYILQRINTAVFKDPEGLATTHLKIQEALSGQDHPLEIAILIPAPNGKLIHFDEDGNAWRMTSFIGDSHTVEVVEEPWQAYEAGRGFGWFNKVCYPLDARDFKEAIKDFQSVSFRMWQLDEAVKNNLAGRLASVKDIVAFYKDRQEAFGLMEKLANEEVIPLRVVHNDTKINNLLFRGQKAAAVIDLDTVGPGILHYDYGDALRTGGNTSSEDERDLGKVDFNMEAFEAFSRGYMEQIRDFVTEAEKDYLYLAPRLMAFIMGIRFLADYLNGDVYYKTAYPGHNHSRSKVQKKLIERMEAREDAMKEIIAGA